MNQDLANYLKSKRGLIRLFEELKNKYISLGRFSGSVKIPNVTEEEARDIGNLLGRKIEFQQDVKTSFKEITKKINEGKYQGFIWQQLLEYYFEKRIVSKADKKVADEVSEEQFFHEILDRNKTNPYINYLKEFIENKNSISKIFHKKYLRDRNLLEKEISNILLLLENLPSTPISLPTFAACTGNPHYLDFNTSNNSLFFKIISEIKKEEVPSTLEEKVNLLSEINIYTDPLSNYVITYQLVGNPILEEASILGETINLNLLNILHSNTIDTKQKKVFIFENPSILNELIELGVPMVITSGIPNLSLYKLLEKLELNGNDMYYSGDLDPEGLLIAEKLKRRFPKLYLFGYESRDYYHGEPQLDINESRLKKLDNVLAEELQGIKLLLLKNRKSAYQEKNIDLILDYIKGQMEIR